MPKIVDVYVTRTATEAIKIVIPDDVLAELGSDSEIGSYAVERALNDPMDELCFHCTGGSLAHEAWSREMNEYADIVEAIDADDNYKILYSE